MPQDFNSCVIGTLGKTYTWSYLHHNILLQNCTKIGAWYTIILCRKCLSWSLLMVHQYTNEKLMVHHWPQHFLPSLHNNPTLSQLCHKLQRRTTVKMNPEQEESNDADNTYTSTSCCIGKICHYIAKEKKYGEWGQSTAQEHW